MTSISTQCNFYLHKQAIKSHKKVQTLIQKYPKPKVKNFATQTKNYVATGTLHNSGVQTLKVAVSTKFTQITQGLNPKRNVETQYFASQTHAKTQCFPSRTTAQTQCVISKSNIQTQCWLENFVDARKITRNAENQTNLQISYLLDNDYRSLVIERVIAKAKSYSLAVSAFRNVHDEETVLVFNPKLTGLCGFEFMPIQALVTEHRKLSVAVPFCCVEENSSLTNKDFFDKLDLAFIRIAGFGYSFCPGISIRTQGLLYKKESDILSFTRPKDRLMAAKCLVWYKSNNKKRVKQCELCRSASIMLCKQRKRIQEGQTPRKIVKRLKADDGSIHLKSRISNSSLDSEVNNTSSFTDPVTCDEASESSRMGSLNSTAESDGSETPSNFNFSLKQEVDDKLSVANDSLEYEAEKMQKDFDIQFPLQCKVSETSLGSSLIENKTLSTTQIALKNEFNETQSICNFAFPLKCEVNNSNSTDTT